MDSINCGLIIGDVRWQTAIHANGTADVIK
jgi:hypothetical protein